MVVLGSTALTLPIITSTKQCADFTLTVKPYIPQFYTIHTALLDALKSNDKIAALQNVYLATNPVIFAFWLSLFFSVFFFLAAEINKNYSQVDRFWSLLPTFYNGHFAVWAWMHGLPTERLFTVLMFSAIWSTRLTFNYWRKGGYSIGSEDYRWETVKRYVGPFWMFIFDISFIAVAQNILLFLITTPTYILLLLSRYTKAEECNYADIAFSRLLVALVLVEFFADQQQWNYYGARTAYRETAKLPPNSKYSAADLDRGFNVSGLWAWSRHPNFAAEQAIWVTLYQWACYESYTFVNWTFAGAISYLILFQSSTWLTEMLSAAKYPEYKEYQRLVGKFLPKVLGKGIGELEEKEKVQPKKEVKKTR